MDLRQKAFAMNALRRAAYKWPPRSRTLKNARVARGKYECAACRSTVGRQEINLDHIDPVVPISGWVTFDSYIKRLLVYDEGWQVLCKPCHSEKTVDENHKRRTGNEPKKEKKKRKKSASSV